MNTPDACSIVVIEPSTEHRTFKIIVEEIGTHEVVREREETVRVREEATRLRECADTMRNLRDGAKRSYEYAVLHYDTARERYERYMRTHSLT